MSRADFSLGGSKVFTNTYLIKQIFPMFIVAADAYSDRIRIIHELDEVVAPVRTRIVHNRNRGGCLFRRLVTEAPVGPVQNVIFSIKVIASDDRGRPANKEDIELVW